MYKIIEEGKAKVNVPKEEKISAKLPVFYNPVMKFNRDMSVLLINSVDDKEIDAALALAGTGVRGVRLLKETKKTKKVFFNDMSKEAIRIIEKNLVGNKIAKSKYEIFNEEANDFMRKVKFNYIDIDPFGTPNPFLDMVCKKAGRNSIVAITATDTAPLAGTYINACKRKYWALPKKDANMHETGLRILIRKVQLVAAQYDKAMVPMFSYYKDHYFRIFFRCIKGKKEVDKVQKQHDMFNGAGPLWTGSLNDKALVMKMKKNNDIEDNQKFLETLYEETRINQLGFYDIHEIAKKIKIKNIPGFELLFDKIKKRKYKVSRTIFSKTGIKSDICYDELVKILNSTK